MPAASVTLTSATTTDIRAEIRLANDALEANFVGMFTLLEANGKLLDRGKLLVMRP